MSDPVISDPGALERNLIERVNVGDLLTRSAARHPGRLAVVDRDRRWCYRDFNAWVNRTAHGLAARGYARGDALALMSANSAEFLVTYFACAKLGVVCVPINLMWRMGEVSYVIEHARVRGAVVEADRLAAFAAAAEGIPAVAEVFVVGEPAEPPAGAGFRLCDFAALAEGRQEAEPEAIVGDRDPVSYLYTSGTTSAPKGVVGSHLAVYLESLGVAVDTGLQRTDRVTAVLPLFHTAQLNALCTPAIAVGAAIYVIRSFDAEALLDLIETERLTQTFALPMMYRAMMDHQERRPRDVSSLRLAYYGMAPIAKNELERAMRLFGCEFSLFFGQTEMSPVSTYFRPEHLLSHAGAVGTPSVNVQVGIMDSEGRLLPQGESGEIVYRSPQVLAGYLRNPEATEAVFRHGWFHSGDAGRIDADGILWFEDRFKDVIKSGGENVASLEVETVIYAVEPKVAECAVIGLPHERWGEAITAVLVAKPGQVIDQAETLARIQAKLSAFKCPKAIITVEALPKTATGKVQKVRVREQFAGFYGERK